MSNILDYFIRFGTNAQSALGQINSSLNRTNSQIAQTTQNVTGLGRAFMFNQAQEAFANFGTLMEGLNGPAIKLEASLAGVKAITGLAGKELDLVETSARNMATAFGVSATDSVQAYSDVLSRLGPHLAKQPKELEAMGKNIAILSKQMGGDMVGSMDALTTSMLQYNVDTTDAAGATKAMGIIMDQISAGTKLGSANVTQVSAALKITGNEAYNAGIAMSETQAAIQVLGQTGLYGAEAGTKFRNVLAKLGEGRFLPKETQDNLRAAGVDIVKLQDKTLTLAQRMQELQKVKGDGALLTQMFGENKGAAMALLQNENLLTSWTKQIATSQGEAAKQTEEHTKTTSSMVNIAKSHWNDLLITMGDYTKAFAPMAAVLMPASQMIVSFGMLMDTWVGGQLKKAVTWLWTSSVSFASWTATVATSGLTAMGTYIASLISATAAQMGFNIAITANPIGIAIAAIAALGLAIYGIVTHWDTIKAYITNWSSWLWQKVTGFASAIWNTFKQVASFIWQYHPVKLMLDAAKSFIPGFDGMWNGFVGGITAAFDKVVGYISNIIDKVKGALGMAKEETKKLTEAETKERMDKWTKLGYMPNMATIMQPKAAGVKQDIAGNTVMSKIATVPTAPKNTKTDKIGQTPKTKKSNEEIVTGGSKSTNVYITLDKLVETINNYNSNLGDLKKRIEDEVLDSLSRVLIMGQRQAE